MVTSGFLFVEDDTWKSMMIKGEYSLSESSKVDERASHIQEESVLFMEFVEDEVKLKLAVVTKNSKTMHCS